MNSPHRRDRTAERQQGRPFAASEPGISELGAQLRAARQAAHLQAPRARQQRWSGTSAGQSDRGRPADHHANQPLWSHAAHSVAIR